MHIDYSIIGFDENDNPVVDVALSQNDALAFLMSLVTTGKVKIVPTDAPTAAATPGATPPPAVTMGKVLKVRKLENKPASKKEKGGRSVVDEKTIERIISLKAAGHKPRDISEKLGVAIANVYYYTATAYAKKLANSNSMVTETPEAVGERAIDKADPMLTSHQFESIRQDIDQGDSANILALNHPDVSSQELRRARQFDVYIEYTRDYERSAK